MVGAIPSYCFIGITGGKKKNLLYFLDIKSEGDWRRDFSLLATWPFLAEQLYLSLGAALGWEQLSAQAWPAAHSLYLARGFTLPAQRHCALSVWFLGCKERWKVGCEVSLRTWKSCGIVQQGTGGAVPGCYYWTNKPQTLSRLKQGSWSGVALGCRKSVNPVFVELMNQLYQLMQIIYPQLLHLWNGRDVHTCLRFLDRCLVNDLCVCSSSHWDLWDVVAEFIGSDF